MDKVITNFEKQKDDDIKTNADLIVFSEMRIGG